MIADAPADISIRRCTVSDAPLLTTLARQTFYNTFTGTCTEDDMQHFLDTFYSEAQITRELQNPEDYNFFAEDSGVPVAFIRFLERPVPFPVNDAGKAIELNRLYVDVNYKGSGIAQTLMNYFMDFASNNGYTFLWLGVWEHNERAKSFYRRYGFSYTGYHHPFPIGDTPQTDEWWALNTK